MTTVRYWASVRAAAGVDEETASGATLEEVLALVRARHGADFERALSVCSFVVDSDPVGTRDHASVAAGSLVDCLPPFAGG